MTSNYYNPTDPNLIYIQSRAETDPALIEEYAEAMAAGAQFPALKAIGEQHTLYIYDGYHRGQAAQKAGLPLCISVKPGTRAEAEWLALAANQEHGLRRSNADKQKIVRLALAHDFGAKLSDRQLAAHCGVSHPTVARIREEMEATGKIYQSTTRIGADGREINVGNIGSYLSIVQLELKVRDWLKQKGDAPIAFLEEIKQRTADGKALFAALGEAITEKHRPGDLWQACNNTLDQLKQRQWRAERAQRIRAMTCLCGQQSLEPVGERDGLMCTSCGRVWNCVADFENVCRGCGRDLRNTLRVEGEQYCADCWDERSAGHTANRAWRCITQTAEVCYLCGKEAIYHNNGWRDLPGADFHLCHDHYTRHQAAVAGFTDAAQLQAALDQLKQTNPDTTPRGLACPHCGMAAVQAADGSLKCINVDCESWWENLIAYQAAVAGPGSAPAETPAQAGDASDAPSGASAGMPQGYPKPLLCHRCGNGRVVKKPSDSGLICLGCNFKWNNLADFRSGQRHHLENNRPPLLKHLELKVKGFPQTCPTGHANPVNGGNCMGCQFHRQTDHGHWVCYHPTHQEPAPATEDTGAELRRQLGRALQADSDRWVKHRQTGLSNSDLVEQIGDKFGLGGGASGPGNTGYWCSGGKNPRFWLGYMGYHSRPPTLAGAALRDAARELLGIPFPGDVADGEGEYDFTGMTTADLEAGLAAIERDGLPLDSPHARRLREELATRKNGAVPSYTLRSDLTYRCQRAGIRFGALLDKIKTTDQADWLDQVLAGLEKEISQVSLAEPIQK